MNQEVVRTKVNVIFTKKCITDKNAHSDEILKKSR